MKLYNRHIEVPYGSLFDATQTGDEDRGQATGKKTVAWCDNGVELCCPAGSESEAFLPA
jgi:hypothetical protein